MSVAWLNTGDNAWQLTAATVVGLQSVPGLVVLYAGIVKKKWAVNSAFMAFYAFAAVLIAWVLWAYNMGFGNQWFPFVGMPHSIISMQDELKQALIPASNTSAAFPMSTMVYFQFVFAAITLVIMAGAVLGRMSFKAWMIFVPLWLTFSYTVGAFSLWGGGFLSSLGVIDYSGGYVIHLSAGVAGFVAAAVIGPRLARDRENFQPNNVLLMLVGAGILWLGWNGFNGGDPYAASRDAGAAVLNTNIATAVSVIVWTIMDIFYFKKPSVIGAVQGMITGLVAITPAAGVVDGWGAIAIGISSGIIPWLSMNLLGKTALFRKVDDTLGVFHTHAVAGLLGGIMTGLLATKAGCAAFALSTPGGAIEGNWHQVWLQLVGAAFIIVLNIIVTYVLLKLISLIVPLRMTEEELLIGDDAVHGEEAYAFFGDGERRPVTGD
ncbi:ammonium transporter [Acidithiobacillus sp. 'AMD consortium']|jgi:Amt family ammonium transporter|uniref:Ammonium transporter n=2 Tax=Acidithiobacillus ferridurans TaxID=1232575 RepID=A0A2Z6IGW8_ACIFI|nr:MULTISPECIES: ammonium transporter [Acidithiobacillus]MBU2715534.1 ammonium transporter [Acidithiobacillus ferridurans]MBU2724852.1 ammonium transporter [Acidithiobacillus ferridurans]MBU2727096.1 ammonium transporter [Acidithiobacillus ferridurans]MBU2731874.1 ammonium transporter [Acidithiobacillus ferridurans]QFG79545.1 ammonium transporter [Acidithiobacillus sp. 'AMD consortium']